MTFLQASLLQSERQPAASATRKAARMTIDTSDADESDDDDDAAAPGPRGAVTPAAAAAAAAVVSEQPGGGGVPADAKTTIPPRVVAAPVDPNAPKVKDRPALSPLEMLPAY